MLRHVEGAEEEKLVKQQQRGKKEPVGRKRKRRRALRWNSQLVLSTGSTMM